MSIDDDEKGRREKAEGGREGRRHVCTDDDCPETTLLNGRARLDQRGQVSYMATTKALLGPLLELKSWSNITITHTCLTGVRMQQLVSTNLYSL
ncbi:unnamed protein product [Calypogeia fissa]